MRERKTRRKSLPWFSMSLMVVALGSVITLFNTGALNAGRGSFGIFVTRALEGTLFSGAVAQNPQSLTVDLADIGLSDGVFISGYPAYSSVLLPHVRDSRIEEARLVIEGMQDVSADAVAAIRVVVNGERMLERVLVPGAREFRWVVDLPTELKNGGDLRVGVQLHGDLPHELCHNERSSGAVLRLYPSSGLELDMRDRVSSLRDVVNLLPSTLAIAVPASGEADYLPLAMRLGARLVRAGHAVSYTDLESLTPDIYRERDVVLLGPAEQLSSLGFRRAGRGSLDGAANVWERNGFAYIGVTDPAGRDVVDFLTGGLLSIARTAYVDPSRYDELSPRDGAVQLGQLGVDTSIQRVSADRTWDIPYRLANLHGGRAPQALNLLVRMPEGPADFTSLIHTELNGVLIDSQRVADGQLNEITVGLPNSLQALNNDLSVYVQRHRDHGGCTITARRYPVQLLPESSLIPASAGQGLNGLAGLPERLVGGVTLRFPHGLSGADRLGAMALGAEVLAGFVPMGAPVNFEYVSLDDDRTQAVHGPFIAINHTPPNAYVPIAVAGDTVTVAGSRRYDFANIRQVADIGVLQAAQANVSRPLQGDPNRTIIQSGLVAHALRDAPSILASDIGQQRAVIIHNDGAYLELE